MEKVLPPPNITWMSGMVDIGPVVQKNIFKVVNLCIFSSPELKFKWREFKFRQMKGHPEI